MPLPKFSPDVEKRLDGGITIRGRHLLSLYKIAAVWPILLKVLEAEGVEVVTFTGVVSGGVGEAVVSTNDEAALFSEATKAAGRVLAEIGVPVDVNVFDLAPGGFTDIGPTVTNTPKDGQPSSFGTDEEDEPFRRYHPV